MLRVPLGAKFHCATLNARFLGRRFLHAERFLLVFVVMLVTFCRIHRQQDGLMGVTCFIRVWEG
jgi:hypothetical protein